MTVLLERDHRFCIVTTRSGRSQKVVTFQQNAWSPSVRTAGHVQSESVVTIAWNTHNPSRETARLIGKAIKIGPHCAQLARDIFARLGRPGQKAIYGLTNLARHHSSDDIERACEQVLQLSRPSYQALKRVLTAGAAAKEARAAADKATLQQQGPHIRQIEEYQRFFDQHATQLSLLPANDPSINQQP